MKKLTHAIFLPTILLASLMLLCTSPVTATTLDLTADKENLTVDETVEFHLEIHPTKPIGGSFQLYKEKAPKEFQLIVVFYEKPSTKRGCPGCGVVEYPLSEDFSRTFYYTAKTLGNYYAEANFGGVQKRVNLTVIMPITTSTTSTTSSTTTSTTSSTTTSTSTTITAPLASTSTTTITKQATTTNTGQGKAASAISLLPVFHILLVLIPVIALAGYLAMRSKGR